LCPDNVDENGVIGGRMDGKWWGGYYGWRWPHGLMTVIQPLCIAAMNAVLLTGDLAYLDLARGQIDLCIERGKLEGGVLLVPHRRTDTGWVDHRPLAPEFALQIALFSQDPKDLARLDRFPERSTHWRRVLPGRGKGDDIHVAPWSEFLAGRLPDYPERILDSQLEEVARRMALVATEESDPETWDVHHWQDRNPVHTEALPQLVCGAPQCIYHGGLQHLRLRPWDPDGRRPGLPPEIAVRVNTIDAEAVEVDIVHTGASRPRKVAFSGGAYGEHRFTQVAIDGGAAVPVGTDLLAVALPPLGTARLQIGMRRFARRPSTELPAM